MSGTLVDWRSRAGVALVAGALVLGFWAVAPSGARAITNPDYLTFYAPVAERLLDGRGYTLPDGQPAMRYPPGYPAYIAVAMLLTRTGLADLSASVVILNALCIALTSLIILDLSARLWPPRIAVACALAFAAYPITLWLTKQPNSEVPFLLPLSGSLAAYVRAVESRGPPAWGFAALTGLLCGVAMLIRPIAIGLGLVYAALLFVRAAPRFRSSSLLLAGIVVTANLVTVLPWEIWLHRHSSRILLLSNNGPASITDGLSYGAPTGRSGRDLQVTWPRPDSAVTALMTRLNAQRSVLTSLGSIGRALRDESTSATGAVVRLMGLKAVRSWYGTYSGRLELQILLMQLFAVPFGIWCAIRALRGPRRGQEYAIAVLAILGYTWGMTIVGLSIVRYLAPSMLLAVPLLGILIQNTPVMVPPRREHSADRKLTSPNHLSRGTDALTG